MADAAFRTIKIRAKSYDDLQKILDRVAQNGWASLGSERRSKVTVADVVDEALAALLERAPKRSR